MPEHGATSPARAGGRILAADDAGLAEAVGLLRAGRAIAFPTETVYGLGADAASEDGIDEIYRIKRRPRDHPLIVHVAQADGAWYWGAGDERARRLARAFWPGPLTLILPRRAGVPALACAGQATVGVRCPSHPVAHRLLAAFESAGGKGVAAPSANRFGRVSPTRAAHVLDDLDGDVALILDGGEAEVGLESTIVDLSVGDAVLRRPGGIDVERLAEVLGAPPRTDDSALPRVSGTLASHYAPNARLELVAAGALDATCDVLVAAGIRIAVWSRQRPRAEVLFWLAAPADARDYARALYSALRRLDVAGVERIVVERPPSGVAWDAARDRLARAAAGDPAPATRPIHVKRFSEGGSQR